MTRSTQMGRVRGNKYTEHNPDNSYQVMDEIFLETGHYECIKDVPASNNIPLDNTYYWRFLPGSGGGTGGGNEWILEIDGEGYLNLYTSEQTAEQYSVDEDGYLVLTLG